MIDSSLRFPIFIFLLIFFSSLEFFFSYRNRELPRLTRWSGNLLLPVISSVFLKVFIPTGLFYFCSIAKNNSFGLFNMIEVHPLFSLIGSIILFDGLIYFQHVLSHKVDFFWRLHRVHHADIDLDTTSALRFHPFEIILSFFYKIFCILVFGFSSESVVLLEIILSSMAMFNHSNLYLPKKIEAFLRLFVVTPQMHIVHHSINQNESDSNYGFNLSIWDRVFGTYTEDFSSSNEIGQRYARQSKDHKILTLLKMPFINYENNNK